MNNNLILTNSELSFLSSYISLSSDFRKKQITFYEDLAKKAAAADKAALDDITSLSDVNADFWNEMDIVLNNISSKIDDLIQ